MKDMKKILSVLTALSFTTIVGINTMACNTTNSDSVKKEMTNEVLADLGLTTKEGESLVETTLAFNDTDNNFNWNVSLNLDASSLLTSENKAKSEDSFNFLVNTLGLTAVGEGEWDQKTFTKEEAAKIKLAVSAVNPELKEITNDFAIKGGTVFVQWTKDEEKIGSEYKINLKSDEEKGVIAKNLPSSLRLLNFDRKQSPLSGFVVGQPKSNIKEGTDISSLLIEEKEGKKIKNLASFISQSLKVTITENNAKAEEFAENDTITVKISFGSVQFSNEYKLVVYSDAGSSN